MKTIKIAGLFLLVLAAACSQAGSASAPDPVSEEDKTLYALGTILAHNADIFDLTEAEAAMVTRGFSDGCAKKTAPFEADSFGPKVMALSRTRMTARAAKEKVEAEKFLAAAEKEEGAKKTASGLVFRTLTAGKGESPKPTDMVKVHYRGTLRDGEEFDSSYKRNAPAEFSLAGVVPCWTEGVGMMKVGEKAQLVCPAAIAYGDRGSPPKIPGGAALKFEIELLEVKAAPPMGLGTFPHGSAVK